MSSKIPANLTLFLLITFVIMALFGVGMSMEMKDGQMSDCPFTANTPSMCQMSAIEHVGQWLGAITAKPAKINHLLDLLLLLSVISAFLVKTFPPHYARELTARIKSYIRITVVKILTPLRLAFADGLIHPKIYSPKIIN